MSDQEIPLSKQDQLALAIARGTSVTLWSRANQVPRRTAFRWASDPKVRDVVETCRRRARDRAIGRMARRATWASDQFAMLAKTAESEPVKLRALRSIFSDVLAVSKGPDLKSRLAEIEAI
jgi:hypothetical protein